MFTKFIVRVFTSNKLKLKEFGRMLVKDGFAESAHLMQMESFYSYQGKVLDQYIWSLEIMTTEERYASIYALANNQFRQEIFCIMAYPVMMTDIFWNTNEKEDLKQPDHIIDIDAKEVIQ